MDNSIKDINHSLSIQAETLGEPAETEASWYAMRVYMNKVALCRDLFNLFNNALKDPDQMTNTFPEDMMGDVMEYYAPFVRRLWWSAHSYPRFSSCAATSNRRYAWSGNWVARQGYIASWWTSTHSPSPFPCDRCRCS